GTNFPDAVAACPAAATDDAPILLVSPTWVPASTMGELARLDPALVVVAGGPAAVADSVLEQIASALPKTAVERRWGTNRFETAVALSQGAFAGPVDTVFVAGGDDFPDALVAAPAAVAAGAPLLLVHPNGLHGSVAAEIQRLDPSTIVIVGDETAVPAGVQAQLEALAPSVRRIDGSNRYSIGVNLSADQWPGGADTVYLARADIYPDALAAGPMTRLDNGPLLLIDSDHMPLAVQDELDRLAPSKIFILGGTSAVSPTVVAALNLGNSGFESTAISPGDSGPAVEYLQRVLTHARLYRGPIDGYYPNDPWELPGTMTSAVYAFHKLHESPAGDAWTSTDHVGTTWTVQDWQRLVDFRSEAPISRPGEPDRFEVDVHHEVMWMILDGEVAGIFHVSVGGEFWYIWDGSWELAHTPRGDLSVLSYSLVRYREQGWMHRAWWYDPGNLTEYSHRWLSMHGYYTVPPYPASHGCVRVVYDDADWIYARIGQGVGLPFHIWDG
ncbi:MAG TPA: cell wall-binding repeat-containing protein, partial [Gemmatimonadales bacterium]|nr:cell wall-binding repeat-containing protein [Gemmatimonadales bacterium]